jgi:hypothetical protein
VLGLDQPLVAGRHSREESLQARTILEDRSRGNLRRKLRFQLEQEAPGIDPADYLRRRMLYGTVVPPIQFDRLDAPAERPEAQSRSELRVNENAWGRHPASRKVVEKLVGHLASDQYGIAGRDSQQSLYGELANLPDKGWVFEPPRARSQPQIELGVEVMSLRGAGQVSSRCGFYANGAPVSVVLYLADVVEEGAT